MTATGLTHCYSEIAQSGFGIIRVKMAVWKSHSYLLALNLPLFRRERLRIAGVQLNPDTASTDISLPPPF